MLNEARTIPYICGIDEAGRGPVIGPLVYSIAFAREDVDIKGLFKGIDDSKKLNKVMRDTLLSQINSSPDIEAFTTVTHANTISFSMLKRSKYNLNQMSHDIAIELIKKVIKTLKERNDGSYLAGIFVDTVGMPEPYKVKLESIFPDVAQVVVTSKADSLFPIVSAASIVAKTTRDEQVENFKAAHNLDISNGYPSEPKTKEYLNEHFDELFCFDPTYVRLSWGSVRTLVLNRGITVEWSDDEESNDDEEMGRKRKRTSNLGLKSTRKKQSKQLSFAIRDAKNQRCSLVRNLTFSSPDDFF